jgi:hypothetical protein
MVTSFLLDWQWLAVYCIAKTPYTLPELNIRRRNGWISQHCRERKFATCIAHHHIIFFYYLLYLDGALVLIYGIYIF